MFRHLKLKKEEPGFYLDIGAYHPYKDSITKFLYDLEWKGICVDMNQASIDLFAEERPKDIAVCCAVSDEVGEITGFFQPGAISVVNTCDPNVAKKQASRGNIPEEKIVIAKTANQLMKELAPNVSKIDFLNIDVEGLELNVLKSLDFSAFKPSVVALEIHAKSLDDCLKTEVAGYMRYLGYFPLASCVITTFWVRKP